MIRMGDIHATAVEKGWERIRCGVQDVKDGVIRDVHRAGVSFRCPTYVGGGWREVDVRQVRMGAPVEVVDSFCYLGDVIQCEGGAEAAARGRIACIWKSWRELASLQ